jgi:TfoX/Sxy family transcriptional regulator of competence genes
MFDEALAERIRLVLAPRAAFTERKMFGGVAFLIGGNMACGIVRQELMVRTGPDQYAEALARPHARPMEFTGRPMKGMVFVGEGGLGKELAAWVEMGASYASGLPPKVRK